MAALVGYSRIYLGQHFMDDVLAGSVIGVVSAIVCELFLEKKIRKIFYKTNSK
jgi:membrane-associated phospholipid phosphatase